jgi:hypothetical protein
VCLENERWPAWVHASLLTAHKAEAEAKALARRKAAPDPLRVLRQARQAGAEMAITDGESGCRNPAN